jgi:hypothetical protein
MIVTGRKKQQNELMSQRSIADSRTGRRGSVSWFGANPGEGVFDIINILNRVEVAA